MTDNNTNNTNNTNDTNNTNNTNDTNNTNTTTTTTNNNNDTNDTTTTNNNNDTNDTNSTNNTVTNSTVTNSTNSTNNTVTNTNNNNTKTNKKKRKKIVDKPLPPGLEKIGPQDYRAFRFAVEVINTDKDDGTPQECNIVQSVMTENGIVDLTKLNTRQLRRLCGQFGVRYANKCNKFSGRKAISSLVEYYEKLERSGQQIPYKKIRSPPTREGDVASVSSEDRAPSLNKRKRSSMATSNVTKQVKMQKLQTLKAEEEHHKIDRQCKLEDLICKVGDRIRALRCEMRVETDEENKMDSKLELQRLLKKREEYLKLVDS